jgi:hypothetical protein
MTKILGPVVMEESEDRLNRLPKTNANRVEGVPPKNESGYDSLLIIQKKNRKNEEKFEI